MLECHTFHQVLNKFLCVLSGAKQTSVFFYPSSHKSQPATDSPKIVIVDRFRKLTVVFRGMDCRSGCNDHPIAASPWVATESLDRASRRLFGGFLEVEVVLSLWSLWSWLGLCSSLLWSLKLLTNDFGSVTNPMPDTPPANFLGTFFAGVYNANYFGE